jgi:hypothetical protein
MVLRGWKGKQVLGVCDNFLAPFGTAVPAPEHEPRSASEIPTVVLGNVQTGSRRRWKSGGIRLNTSSDYHDPRRDQIAKQRSRLDTCCVGSSASSWLHLHHLSEGNSAHMPKTLLKPPTFILLSPNTTPIQSHEVVVNHSISNGWVQARTATHSRFVPMSGILLWLFHIAAHVF